MRFATIDTTTMTIWATGDTAEESAENARENVTWLGSTRRRRCGRRIRVVGPLETVECTRAVFDEVEGQGGDFDNSPGHEWTIYVHSDGSKLLRMVTE